MALLVSARLDLAPRRAQNPSAARHFLTTMRRMFAWAVAQKILPIDPTEGIKTPRPAKTEGFVTWSDADVHRYYKRWPLGTRERVMIDVYLFTGFRRGEPPGRWAGRGAERLSLNGPVT